GYWMLMRDGTVEAFGDAVHRGNLPPGRVATDIAALPDGSGYAVLDETGEVRVFRAGGTSVLGDASRRLTPAVGQRSVGLAITADGKGAWVTTAGPVRDHRIHTAQGPYGLLRPAWPSCPVIRWYHDPSTSPADGL